MALTTRKEIKDDIVYRMGQVTTLTTVTDSSRDTDVEPFAPEECPALVVKVGDGQITHNVSDDEHELKVSLELHTTSRITADAAESLLGDVAAKVAANETWGGHADGTNIESHGVDVSQTGDVITAATLDITVHYTTDKGKI